MQTQGSNGPGDEMHSCAVSPVCVIMEEGLKADIAVSPGG